MTSDRRRDERARLGAFFKAGLSAAEAEAPSYEEIEGYVDDTLDAEARELFELRRADDPQLQQEVRDLHELRGELDRDSRPGVSYAWPGLLAAAGLVLVVWATFFRDRPLPPPMADGPPSSAPESRQALRDGSRTVTWTADGQVTGLEGLPAERQREVAQALASGRVALPEVVSVLRGRPVVFMGAPGDGAGFRVLAPLATIVRTPRPAFRWRAHPQARAYVVSVHDEDLQRLAVSPEVRGTEWTPAADLPRERTLLWQVAALTPAGREVAPAPPEPEARFRVLGREAGASLEEALAGGAGSHLALGVALAQAGIVDEARAELAALVEANPESAPARRLLDSLAEGSSPP